MPERELIALALVAIAALAGLLAWRFRARRLRDSRHRHERIDLTRGPPPGT